MSTHLGMSIRLRRIEAGMEIKDLEKKSGVSFSAISRLERRKKSIKVSELVAICTVLKISPHQLLCGSEAWQPEKVIL